MSSLAAPPAFGDFTRLDDDMVKLVAYTIVSLLRDKEILMPGGKDQKLVVDNMTGDQFVGQIIAEYTAKKEFLDMTPEEQLAHRKYLRVYYVVSQRWPRQPMKFEERQVKTLQEIKDRL